MNNKKSKSTYHYFKGTAKWTQLKTTDQYGNYSINFEFENEDEIQKYKDSGIMVKLNSDGKSVYFKRPPSKIYNKELVDLGPPSVVDKDGNELDVLIGAGSKVTVKVKAYPTIKGKGHELLAIQINELVEVPGYNKEYNF